MAYSKSKTLRDTFIFDLISSSKGDLTACERLYIVDKLSYTKKTNMRWLADLYMRCGCFSEAKKIYENLGHWRKLGDLASVNNDLVSAEYYYSKEDENRNGSVFRGSKDWDRLIKLAFHQSEWKKLINIMFESNLSAFGNDIILGSSSMSSKPYLKMLALAVVKCEMKNDLALTDKVLKSLPINRQGWNQLLDSVSTISQQVLTKMQEKSVPRVMKIHYLTLGEAMKKGNTSRANQISRAIECIDTSLEDMADRLYLFLKAKDRTIIQQIVGLINDFSDESLAKTFLRVLVSKVYQLLNENSNCHLSVEFYESHPIIRRLYFGDLLRLKFENNIKVQPSDIYTGLLQCVSSIEADIADVPKKIQKKEGLLEFNKLVAYYDWIEIKLGVWMESEGAAPLQRVISIWNNGKARSVKTLFDTTKHYPNSPREMIEWAELLKDFHRWITKCWSNEIGIEGWKSEKSLFDIIKKHFKGFDVLRHAQPIWLEPQHLDIFLPELSLAIEYMGEQHYRPVEYFGGNEGFEATTDRDERKAEICKKVGVNLVYVRFDDDIKKRVEQITRAYNSRREN
jgi:hypothetical protein